jgi:hypothetical protein
MIEFIRSNPEDVLTESSQQELKKLCQIEAVGVGLSSGGWIAGGAIRTLLRGESLQSYFSNPADRVPGDIDIFFPDVAHANIAMKSMDFSKRRYSTRSFGGSATQVTDYLGTDTVTVQYVDKEDLCMQSIDTCLSRFDFVNCMVAFDGKSIVMPKGWRELDSENTLCIHNAHSPFLAARIKKYVKWRGYKGISRDSREIFVDWLVRSLDSSNFSSFGSGELSALEKVKEIGHLLTSEELLLFIGKWSISERENYGHMIEERIDWAIGQINKNSKNACSSSSL